jgi:hypothetical protein
MSWCVEQVVVVPGVPVTQTAKKPLVPVAQVEWFCKVFTWIQIEQ